MHWVITDPAMCTLHDAAVSGVCGAGLIQAGFWTGACAVLP